MDAARSLSSHIDDSPARPVIAGTDIKVSQIASEAEHLGMSPDEIVTAHPHLSLADVHAALAYYFDHQQMIREEWRAARALIVEMRERYPSRLLPRKS